MSKKMSGGGGFSKRQLVTAVVVTAVLVAGIAVGVYFAFGRGSGRKDAGGKKTRPSQAGEEEKKQSAPEVPGKLVEKVVFQRGGSIWIMNPDGSGAKRLTYQGKDDYPRLSPDGRWVVFDRRPGGSASEGSAAGSIYRIGTDGKNIKRLTNPGSRGRSCEQASFSPEGTRICYAFQEKAGDAQRVGIAELDMSGEDMKETTVVAEETMGGTRFYCPRYTPAGDAIYFNYSPGGGPPLCSLQMIFADGTGRTTVAETEPGAPVVNGYWDFGISPDGKRIACALISQAHPGFLSELCTMKMDGSDRMPINLGFKPLGAPWIATVCWSPDGLEIGFTDMAQQDPAMWVIGSDGKGLRRVASEAGHLDWGRAIEE